MANESPNTDSVWSREKWENWEKDVKPALKIMDTIAAAMPCIKDGTYQLNYSSKNYIGFAQNGKAKNFAVFSPQGKALSINVGMNQSPEIDKIGKVLTSFEHKVDSRNNGFYCFKFPVNEAVTAEQLQAAIHIMDVACKSKEKEEANSCNKEAEEKGNAEAAKAKAQAEAKKAKAEAERLAAESAAAAAAKAAADKAKAELERQKAEAEAAKAELERIKAETAKAKAEAEKAKAAAEAAQAEAEKATAAPASTAAPANKGNKGALPGLFSVAANKKVRFSMGNLQFNPKKYEFRFALHQWDAIKADNSKIATNYDGWIDLFGYGTSGYMGVEPTETSNNDDQYPEESIANTNKDWGVYNPITNGGNKEGLWRTLTKDEWEYLFKNRPNAAKLRAKANVNGVNGAIILPDDFFEHRARVPFDSTPDNFSGNTYDAAQWTIMEAAGAIFLPCGGYREGTSMKGPDWYYWTSTAYSGLSSYRVYLFDTNSHWKRTGYSVRLVQDVK